MLGLVLSACVTPVDLTGLEPLTAVSLFRFVAMAEDERRVLAITIPDLVVDGETEAEADLAGWSEGYGLELFTGRHLEPIVTAPWGHSSGWGRCHVEDRWYAVEGRVRIQSDTPFEGLVSESITVEVEDVVVESQTTEERMEVGGQSWTLPLDFSYDFTEQLDYRRGQVGDCLDDD